MKNILFIIAFLPLCLFGQLRADQLPEINDPAGTDAFYSAERGSFRKIKLSTLSTFFAADGVDTMYISNDTIYLTTAAETFFAVLPAGGGSGDMVLASTQTVTGAKTFNTGTLKLAGSTSGETILNAAAVAGAGTVTLPTTGTLATLGGAETFTGRKQFTSTATNAGIGFTGVAAAPSAAATGGIWYRTDSEAFQYRGAATNKTLVDLSLSQTLTNKTMSGAANTFTGIDLTSSVTGELPSANLANTAVTPGSYTSADITINSKGQITAAANGSGGGTIPDNWRNITGGTVSTSLSDNIYRNGKILLGTNNATYMQGVINTFSTTTSIAARFFNSFAGASSVNLINFNGATNATAQYTAETASNNATFGVAGSGFSGIYIPGETYLNASKGIKFHANNGDIRWTFTGSHTVGMLLSTDQRLIIGGSSTPTYRMEIDGTDAAALFVPHDVTLTGTEGLFYADNSENTFKGHNGTEFFRFMQQSTTVPTAGQIGVWNATSLLYEPSDPKARSYTPTATADANGEEGDIAYDDSYIYIKTSAGWKRAALSTF